MDIEYERFIGNQPPEGHLLLKVDREGDGGGGSGGGDGSGFAGVEGDFDDDNDGIADTLGDFFDFDPQGLGSGDGTFGGGDGSSAGGGLTGPTTPEPTVDPDPFGINDLSTQATDLQAFLGENVTDRLGGAANRFDQISTGVDPRFDALRRAQFSQLGAEQSTQQQQQGEFFSRRGVSGSSAALNAENKLTGGFAAQRNMLAAQLGLQQLGRQDQAISTAAGFRERQGQSAIGAFETGTIPAQLQIAELAARNAGKS